MPDRRRPARGVSPGAGDDLLTSQFYDDAQHHLYSLLTCLRAITMPHPLPSGLSLLSETDCTLLRAFGQYPVNLPTQVLQANANIRDLQMLTAQQAEAIVRLQGVLDTQQRVVAGLVERLTLLERPATTIVGQPTVQVHPAPARQPGVAATTGAVVSVSTGITATANPVAGPVAAVAVEQVSIDVLRSALTQYTQRFGIERARTLVATVGGATTISAVSADRRTTLYAAIQQQSEAPAVAMGAR